MCAANPCVQREAGFGVTGVTERRFANGHPGCTKTPTYQRGRVNESDCANALQSCSTLALLLIFGSYAGAALALGSSEQRAACTPDVFRLCSAQIPNVDAIVACLKREKSNLSPDCKAVFDVPERAATSRSLAPGAEDWCAFGANRMPASKSGATGVERPPTEDCLCHPCAANKACSCRLLMEGRGQRRFEFARGWG